MVDFQHRDTRRGLDDALGEDERATEAASEEGGETTDRATDDSEDEMGGLQVAILTVSATRSLEDDPSGEAIATAVEAAGHAVVTRELVRGDYDGVQQTVDALTRRDDVDLILTTGGIGLGPTDATIEATKPLFEKRLPGFGELFRRRLDDEIGSGTIANRTIAGIADGVVVVCLPEDVPLVRLGLDTLLPDVRELVADVAGPPANAEE